MEWICLSSLSDSIWLSWKVGKGSQVLFGIDPFLGGGETFVIFSYIIDYFENSRLCTLDQIKRPSWLKISNSYWLVTKDLELGG